MHSVDLLLVAPTKPGTKHHFQNHTSTKFVRTPYPFEKTHTACADNDRTPHFEQCSACESDYQISQQETRRISTPRLNTSLCFHLVPINVVVSYGSQTIPNLRVGFPLRCFQRLSVPDIATRRCHWRDSRYTRGQFIPVLSSRTPNDQTIWLIVYFPCFQERRLYLHPSSIRTRSGVVACYLHGPFRFRKIRSHTSLHVHGSVHSASRYGVKPNCFTSALRDRLRCAE